MSELIQCEFCEIYVDFNEYLYHVRECINSSIQSSIQSSLQSSIVISTNSNDDDYENIDEIVRIDGDDDNHYLNSNPCPKWANKKKLCYRPARSNKTN